MSVQDIHAFSRNSYHIDASEIVYVSACKDSGGK